MFQFSPLLMVHKVDEKNFTMSGLLFEIMNMLEDALDIE